ncbi:MAG: hypothetical protein EXR86_13775 [Gammaproteobacteria bacterium]|nr:hypothetical protein [Gammaproteobacteria bacterium]
MKWFAVLLVLANVLYFGWGYEKTLREAAKVKPGPAPLSATTPSLSLVSELDQLPPPREQAATPRVPEVVAEIVAPATATIQAAEATRTSDIPPTTPAPTAPAAPSPPSATPLTNREVASVGAPTDICVEVGPFSAATEADNFEAWLSPRAAALHRVSQTVRKKKFFWVYLEPHSVSEAQANVADLQRKGVSDILLLRRDGLKSAISLGLFSSQDAVNRRLAEMSKQGYKPVVVPKITLTERFWLRANLTVGYEDLSSVPSAQLAGAAVTPIACAKIADPPPSP